MVNVLEDIDKFTAIFEAIPGYNALVRANPPIFTVVAVTDDYLSHSGSSKVSLIGNGIFESFPSNPLDPNDTGHENLLASFNYVIENKRSHQLPVHRYDVPDQHGTFIERYWVSKNNPVFDDNGEVTYIIHSAEEITDTIKVHATKELMAGMKHAQNMFEQAPVAISILKGWDFKIELANEKMTDIYGKGKVILNRPLTEILPELEAQGHLELLHNVMKTGQQYYGYESPLNFVEKGVSYQKYFNFVYKPYFDDDEKTPSGVLVFVNEVTDKMAIRKNLLESEERFRTMAEGTKILIGVADESSNATYFNKAWTELTGRSMQELVKFGWLDIVHPDDQERWLDLYLSAFKKREPFSGEFRILDQYGQYRWLLATGPARFRPDGSFAGYVSSCIDITERKQAEQDLIQTSEKFKKLLEALPQMTWTNLPSGEINFHSSRWYEYTGVVEGTMANWSWKDIVHSDDLDATLKAYREALQSGQSFAIENRFKRSDGNYRWHLNRALPISTEGEISLWIGTATDIHDLKEAETALQASEHSIRALVESAPFPIGVYIGREMRIELANQSIITVWGKGHDVVGKLYSEVLPELDNQDIFNQLQGVYETGIPFHAKHQRVDLSINGKLQTFYFNYSFTPLFNGQGKVYGVMNTAADVTDLNLAKQKIENSEAQLRSLVMSAPIGICIVSGEDFEVEVVNDSFLEVIGKHRENITNLPYFMGLPEMAEDFAPVLKSVLSSGVMYRCDDQEVKLIRNGRGEIRYFNVVYDPIKEADGSINRVMVVLIEVTEQVIARRKIEDVVNERTKELAEVNRNLKKSNDELAQFAYITSHDLQEPLRKVSTFSQLLEQGLPEIDEFSRSYLDKINSSTARMANLIKDVLAYSQLVKDNELYQSVNLQQVVEWVENDFELLIEQKHAVIHSSGLPSIQAIPLQMSQLVSNLISNALKFSIENVDPVITITGHAMTKEEIVAHSLETDMIYYLIQFRDNGIGFNQEYATRIFNIFQRLHNKTEYSGTGIGLAMCKKITQNHHGDIYATAVKGAGAVFNVILPERQPVA